MYWWVELTLNATKRSLGFANASDANRPGEFRLSYRAIARSDGRGAAWHLKSAPRTLAVLALRLG